MTSEHPSKLTQFRFSTDGTPPADRVRLWEGHNSKALIPLDIRTLDSAPLKAQETNINLPTVRIADVVGSAQIVERSEAFISDNPTGVIAMFFAIEGDAFFFHQQGHINLRPGQAIVYDVDRPFTRGFSQGLREVVLTIPKFHYYDIIPSPAPKLPYVFDFVSKQATPQAKALAAMLHDTLSASASEKLLKVDELEDQTLALAGGVLGANAGESGALAIARNHIEANLSNPNLTVGEVAAAAGVSERQLNRIFADFGKPVASYILGRRLTLARGALASPTHAQYSVAEIAALFGFNSQSYFTRTFKQAYGDTPTGWRKENRTLHG